MVVVWNTLNVSRGGEVTILAKAHTDVDINTMKVAFFDDTRYRIFGCDFSICFPICWWVICELEMLVTSNKLI